MKALSLQESTEQRASARNESGGRGGGEGVGIRLICCIPGQFQYLDNYGFFSGAAAAETSRLLIRKRAAEQRRQRWRWTPKGGERDVVFGDGCRILVTFAASVSFPATD